MIATTAGRPPAGLPAAVWQASAAWIAAPHPFQAIRGAS